MSQGQNVSYFNEISCFVFPQISTTACILLNTFSWRALVTLVCLSQTLFLPLQPPRICEPSLLEFLYPLRFFVSKKSPWQQATVMELSRLTCTTRCDCDFSSIRQKPFQQNLALARLFSLQCRCKRSLTLHKLWYTPSYFHLMLGIWDVTVLYYWEFHKYGPYLIACMMIYEKNASRIIVRLRGL